MKEERFSELIKKYQEGKASSAEIELIEAWLDSRKDFETYGKLSDIEVQKIKKSIKSGVDNRIESKNYDKVKLGRGFNIIRRAAAILIVVVAGFLLWEMIGNFAEKTQIQIAQSSGEVKKVILNDGSIVWLKGNSSLTYPEEFTGEQRLVELDGEALFEITKAYTEPGLWGRIIGEKSVRKSFIVKSGSLKTRVMGTSFNIKTKPGETEVYVLTGKVEVLLDEEKGLELLPNERSVFEHDLQKLTKINQESLSMDSIRKAPTFGEYTQGTEYDMYFENIELNEVAKRITEKFDVEIAVEESMKNCLIRADFTDQSLENTLELIVETLNGSYKIEKEMVYLSGRGCY